jgi:hypothetical protein
MATTTAEIPCTEIIHDFIGEWKISPVRIEAVHHVNVGMSSHLYADYNRAWKSGSGMEDERSEQWPRLGRDANVVVERMRWRTSALRMCEMLFCPCTPYILAIMSSLQDLTVHTHKYHGELSISLRVFQAQDPMRYSTVFFGTVRDCPREPGWPSLDSLLRRHHRSCFLFRPSHSITVPQRSIIVRSVHH